MISPNNVKPFSFITQLSPLKKHFCSLFHGVLMLSQSRKIAQFIGLSVFNLNVDVEKNVKVEILLETIIST